MSPPSKKSLIDSNLLQHATSPSSGTLVYQGAEARLYESALYTHSSHPRQCLVKERFVKKYRHPVLDANLSMQRLRAEVRQLTHCRRLGIDVPPVLLVDVPTRRLWIGRIGPNAQTLHEWFGKLAVQQSVSNNVIGLRLQQLIRALGRILARLHANHIIHGDLTMANILVREPTEEELCGTIEPRLALIDFGLSNTLSHSCIQRLPEEKAVDLYVFERALVNACDHDLLNSLGSSFPQFGSVEQLTGVILDHYCQFYPTQVTQLRYGKSGEAGDIPASFQSEVKAIISKLDEVRLRGRKRLMIG